jgi:hypothetical protein
MLFNIINPSDSYTIKTDDKEAACVACLLMGEGQYGLEEIGGKFEMPILMFGGGDEFFKSQFGKSMEESVKLYRGDKVAVLIETLRSTLVGSVGERQTHEDALKFITDPEKRQQYIDEYKDKKRGSMNNIGGYAIRLADHLEKRMEKTNV